MKKWLSNYGCGVLIVLFNVAILCLIVFAIINGNKQKKIKAQVEREQFVKDSIAEATRELQQQRYNDSIEAVINSKEYKDSVEAAEKMEQEMEDRMTVVIFAEGDSLFHYSTECSMLDNNSSMQLMTQKKAKQFGKSICPECYDREDVYCGYTSGDYIHIDELPLDDY